MVWDREQNLELIRLYKAHPLLYQSNHPGNNNKIRREIAYVEIAEEMQDIRPGTTVRQIKGRIKNIRLQYFKQQKNSGDKKFTTLWCQDYLRFLDEDFLTDKTLKKKVESDPPELDCKKYDEETVSDTDSVVTRESLCSYEQVEHLQNAYLEQEEDLLNDHEILMDDESNDGASPDMCENKYNVSDVSETEMMLNGVNDVKYSSKIQHKGEYPAEINTTTCDTIEVSKLLVIKINETLDRTNILLNKLNHVKESVNRPFIENLLLDLNKLPEKALRRTKWKITNIVCKTYLEEQEKNESVRHCEAES